MAGYVAAIKAGQEGLKVTCVEKRGALGGTCLNVGCIPSKSLLNNSHLYHQVLHDTASRGIEVGDVKLNLDLLMKAKEQSVTGLTKGIEFLFKKNGVEYVKGTGSFVDEHTIKVDLNEGGETTLVGKNILIATGSEATPFPGLEIDEKRVITSTGALSLEKVPESLVVIGGGIIGLEMGSVWSRLGAKVTVVEFLDQIGGPGMDAETSKLAQKLLKKQGIDFKLGTKVISGDTSGENIKLEIDSAKGGKPETVSVLFCVCVCVCDWGGETACSTRLWRVSLSEPLLMVLCCADRRRSGACCHRPPALHDGSWTGECRPGS